MISRRVMLGALLAAGAAAAPNDASAKETLVDIFRRRREKAAAKAAGKPVQTAVAKPAQKPAKGQKKPFQVDPKYEPQIVKFERQWKPGTIVIDSKTRFLYLVEQPGFARRYGVAVGREGLGWRGRAKIGRMVEWPRWIPTAQMIKREPDKYLKYAGGVEGGPDNPLGARAMYLHQGGKETYIRIHGTTQPQSIGQAASNGCFRMVNEHVMDLYARVKIGTEVIVR